MQHKKRLYYCNHLWYNDSMAKRYGTIYLSLMHCLKNLFSLYGIVAEQDLKKIMPGEEHRIEHIVAQEITEKFVLTREPDYVGDADLFFMKRSIQERWAGRKINVWITERSPITD